MKKHVIYMHVNTVNGKAYIGKTCQGVEKRWDEHVRTTGRGSQCPFHRAIRKYGDTSFSHHVLESGLCGEGAALAEADWIRKLNTRAPTGYNLTDGGEGCIGYVHSDAAKIKMSAAHNGRVVSAETRAKMSAARRRVVVSPETRLKLSRSIALAWSSPEVRTKQIAAMRLANSSPEVKEIRSKAYKKACARPEIKAARSDIQKASWADPKTREHRDSAQRDRWDAYYTKKAADRLDWLLEDFQ